MTDPTPASGGPGTALAPPAPDVRPRRSRARRILLVVAVVATVLALAAAGGLVYAYTHLSGNISTIDDIQDQTDRPAAVAPTAPEVQPPLNILLIGSDSRAGDNGFVGGVAGVGLSDTAMVLHVSGDRTRATAVSIPRDSMVQMPTCKRRDGSTAPAGLQQFNAAYTIGGASCVRRTVEQLTGVRIDHYVVVDFAGFRDIVEALGGVKVYLPEAVNDASHGIVLPAGCQTLDGEQALKYVRVRYIGNGSDIERLDRQQAFLSSVIQKVTERGTITNPVKLYRFLDAATKSLSTDKELDSVGALAALAQDLNQVGLDRIEFMTVPWRAYPADPNRIEWSPQADKVWKAFRSDQPLPGSQPEEPAERPLVAAPATISVRVLNGTDTTGAAAAAADELTSLGYQVVSVGNAKKPVDATVVRWSAGRNQSARTLSAATTAPAEKVAGLGQTLTLLLGPDYAGASKVKVKAPGSQPTFDTRTADTPICR